MHIIGCSKANSIWQSMMIFLLSTYSLKEKINKIHSRPLIIIHFPLTYKNYMNNAILFQICAEKIVVNIE